MGAREHLINFFFQNRGMFRDSPRIYITTNTNGAHVAPTKSPYRTLTACGMILFKCETEERTSFRIDLLSVKMER